MTIHDARGNLLKADAEALVNTVNTVGVMGKGIALQFRKAFPDNFRAYEAACRQGEIRLGQVFVHATGKLTENPRYIINFPTKKHWRSKARLSDIRRGLADLVRAIEDLQIRSIAIPPLGCGLGGLAWSQVRPLIVEALAPLEDVEVMLYSPVGTPAASEMPIATARPRLTRVRTALVALLAEYVDQVSRGATPVEVQKLAYLLERVGEPLNLQFAKGPYGPYSTTLEHVLNDIERHFIVGFGDRSRRIAEAEPITVLPEAVDEVAAEAVRHGVQPNVQRVLRLVDGFNSAYGTELIATVDWAVTHELGGSADLDKVLEVVRSWNQRKARIFTEPHVAHALERLGACGLIAA